MLQQAASKLSKYDLIKMGMLYIFSRWNFSRSGFVYFVPLIHIYSFNQ